MTTKTLIFRCPEHYSLKTLSLTHGWRQLHPFSWDGETLGYVLHTGSQTVDLQVTQESGVLSAVVTGDGHMGEDELKAVEAALVAMLGLDRNTLPIRRLAEETSEAYVDLVKAGAGRILIAPTVWENAVKTLFTTNCSWTLTRRMAERICSDAFTTPAPSGRYPFPSPAEVNRFSAEDLKNLIPAGYRAPYLKALAASFVAHPGIEGLLMAETLPHADVKRKISGWKGFGEYARIHLMTLLGFYGEIPVDSVVRGYMKEVHGVADVPPFLESQYGDWGTHRWWKFKLESITKCKNFP